VVERRSEPRGSPGDEHPDMSRHDPEVGVGVAPENDAQAYPPIDDYAFIGDGHSGALVSRRGAIDWCCLPRLDAGSAFGRLLDWNRGGHCTLTPADPEVEVSRAYLEDTMVLETTFRGPTGEARLIDVFTLADLAAAGDDRGQPYHQLLRVVVGTRGHLRFTVEVQARFDYGSVKPWLRLHGRGVWSAIGGNDAIVVATNLPLAIVDRHDLCGSVTVHAGERARLSLTAYRPEVLDPTPPPQADAKELDRRLDATVEAWRAWAATTRSTAPLGADTRRSALVLKSLINPFTGAMAAAATTSLPEAMGGSRNWDYRFSWIRDSQFAVRSLAELGCTTEADAFRRFIQRSAAGSADDLQIMYGLGGERRLTEEILPLEGYRHSTPVRIGNAAARQLQLDVYGELLDLSWRWHRRGRSPDDDYWRFLEQLVDTAAERWHLPDRGLWELRGTPRHFVHSKAMCWVALDRGIRLAEECQRRAPLTRWRRTRDRIHRSIHDHGVDRARGCFVQAYGGTDVDAALLLLPTVDFVTFDDPLMVATVAAIEEDLTVDGLIRRSS